MESDDDFQHLAGNSSLQLRKLPYGESRQSMLAASGANSEIVRQRLPFPRTTTDVLDRLASSSGTNACRKDG